jgi:hypothetical protein
MSGKGAVTAAARGIGHLAGHLIGIAAPLLARAGPLARRAVRRLRGADRPACTLLYVSERRVVRADGDAQGRLIGETLEDRGRCDGPEQLPLRLADALANLDHPLGRRVWILYDGLPPVTVNIAAAQLMGLEDEALEQALLFDLEGVAPISLAQQGLASLALREEEGFRHYWCGLAPLGLVAGLRQILRERGGRLQGIGHPGGVPVFLHEAVPDAGISPSPQPSPARGEGAGSAGVAPEAAPHPSPLPQGAREKNQGAGAGAAASASPEEWLRLEYWPGCILGHAIGRRGSRRVEIFPGGSGSAKALAAAERWKASLPAITEAHRESLVGEMGMMDAAGISACQLDNPTHLRHWLAAWLGSLAQTSATGDGAPLPLHRHRPGPEYEQRLQIAIVAGALAVCLAHYGWGRYQQVGLEREAARLRQIATETKSLQEGIQGGQKERERIQQDLKAAALLTAANAPRIVGTLRHRHEELLRILALHRDDDTILEELAPGPDTIVLRGVALRADAAHHLRATLDDHLHHLGWHAAPPTKTDLGYFTRTGPSGTFQGSGPWRFEIKLQDLGIQGLIQPETHTAQPLQAPPPARGKPP